MNKEIVILTDGEIIYDCKMVTQEELDELQQKASEATDGNISWSVVTDLVIIALDLKVS
jgi:translation elongation factor EF-1alpha